MNRAYSLLTIKTVDNERRTIRGVATTPGVDRVGDIVEPLGVQFKNPLPLLWQHRHDQPIGTVKFDKPTKDGITFEAELPIVNEAGTLKDRIDEAWQSIKLGLVRGVSIGFKPIEYAFMDEGGIRFIKVALLELSAVTIPANADAVIAGKSLTAANIAALKKFDVRATDVQPVGRKGERQVRLVAPAGKSLARSERIVRLHDNSHRLTANERKQIADLKAGLRFGGVVRLTAEDVRNARRVRG